MWQEARSDRHAVTLREGPVTKNIIDRKPTPPDEALRIVAVLATNLWRS
jgi:hypothetical protein